MLDLCYYRFLKYLEEKNFHIERHSSQKHTTLTIFKDNKSAPLPININFNNYDFSLIHIIETFQLDFSILINNIKRGREITSPRIDEYDDLLNGIVTIHKHCY